MLTRFYLQTISVTLRKRKKNQHKSKKYFADIKNVYIFAMSMNDKRTAPVCRTKDLRNENTN